MLFEAVDPKDIPNMREAHRGRVSYPILKGFLETGIFLAKLDRTGMQQSLQTLTSCLNAYIRSHSLAVKIFQRKGDIYLMRLDMDEKGNEIPNWDKKDPDEVAPSITPDLVSEKFVEEKGQVTK